MATDLIMGLVALSIGAALIVRNGDLAALLREADERWREHPWVQAFEPAEGWLATDRGRTVVFRGWYVASGAGFLAVALGLLLRATL